MPPRVVEPELLDSAPDAEAGASLRDLARINRWLGGHSASLREIADARQGRDEFSVLDVGAASGDHARAIQTRFAKARVVSLDLSARNLAAAPHPRVRADAFRLPFADGAFDLVCCNLFLHHFGDLEIPALLREFARVARNAVIVNDLERHWLAWRFLPATRWLFGWNRITLHDGPVSVRAGFQPEELAAYAVSAGLRPTRIRRVLPWFRIAMVIAVGLLGGCSRRYKMEGMVLEVDRAARSMVVSHRAVPGLMPAMAMPFRAARAAELDDVEPGSRVAFDLVRRQRSSQARGIRVLDTLAADGFRFPVPAGRAKPGDLVPDFSLTAEDGSQVRLSDYRGRLVAINFIYTRCPLPEVCPRLSAVFASLQRRFRDSIPARLALLSITLDPSHDTPPVLAAYARSVRADPAGWRFLTGDVAPVARTYGLSYWAEAGMIVHNSSTPLIGPDGRLIAMAAGSTFRLEQMADLIRHNLR